MKRILITRPRTQADDFAGKLKKAGFEPIYFPVIEIQPIENNIALERALSKLTCYDWVIFTSSNAVEIVFDKHSGLLAGNFEGVKFAAVGPRTAQTLQALGVTPDFIPEEYVAHAILPGLGDLRGRWVLLPRAEIARQTLPEAIFEAGGIPHEIAVYKTLPVQPDSNGLAALEAGVDIVTLTSASIVQNFVEIARGIGLDPLSLPGKPVFACIGPITEQAAREAGLVKVVTATDYTEEGLIEVINNLDTQ
jgi:uroporphyrinogen III methyltransferase/synthase